MDHGRGVGRGTAATIARSSPAASLSCNHMRGRSAGLSRHNFEPAGCMTDSLPTARTMLPQDGWLCLSVRCRGCLHQALADLQAIIDAGQGDKPLKDMKFRCTRVRQLANQCRRHVAGLVAGAGDVPALRPARIRENRYAKNLHQHSASPHARLCAQMAGKANRISHLADPSV